MNVVHHMVHRYALYNVRYVVTVDISQKITRNSMTKEIETKRMKKDYRVLYNKRVIIDDYKTLAYGF